MTAIADLKEVLEEVHGRSWSEEEINTLLIEADISTTPTFTAVDGGGRPGPEGYNPLVPQAAQSGFIDCGEPDQNTCGDPHPGCCC